MTLHDPQDQVAPEDTMTRPAAEPRYDELTREQLVERLNAAEDACLMFGWSAHHEDSDRDIATYLLWRKWLDVAGDFADPKRRHPHLSDKAIAPMVEEYKRQRSAFRETAKAIGISR